MEQNMNATMPVVSGSQQGSGNGLKIATIVASIIAICGIGFGIFGMVQSSQKDSQISDLKVQIQNSDGMVTTIETPKIETNTSDGTVVTITDSVAKDVNPEKYIYVGEWGIKILIGDRLKYVSYYFDVRHDETGEFLYINGLNSAVQTVPSFVNTSTNEYWLVCLSRYPKGDEKGGLFGSEFVFTDDNYDYYFNGPQAPISDDDSDVQLELETVALLKTILKNKDNYSAI